MSAGIQGVRRKLESARTLQSVVRTMKTLAASSVGQYEKSVQSLADYHRTVELGLAECLRRAGPSAIGSEREERDSQHSVGAVVFGSDQGLVGQFNEAAAEYAVRTLAALPGKPQVWAVGERVNARLADAGLTSVGLFNVPNSIQGITPLIGQIQIESEAHRARERYVSLYVFHNRTRSGELLEPVSQRLLPLDAQWRRDSAAVPWPSGRSREVFGGEGTTLRALVREYLFISLFRACAESLASENANRLAAMERADRNIDDLLLGLDGTYHRLRQGGIDDELFDVSSGFEALADGT